MSYEAHDMGLPADTEIMPVGLESGNYISQISDEELKYWAENEWFEDAYPEKADILLEEIDRRANMGSSIGLG